MLEVIQVVCRFVLQQLTELLKTLLSLLFNFASHV